MLPNEATLRDYLADHLDLVEKGLSLVRTEYPVKNEAGSGGFIDILARANSDELVIIELKKSNQSARQALHELEKYVALLAQDRGIRVDRLRCILISTDWRELLVPFARFAGHADYQTTGVLLSLNEDGLPHAAEMVVPPELDAGIEVCPSHILLLYTTPDARNSALSIVDETFWRLAVTDYIVCCLDYAGNSSMVIYPFAAYIAVATFSDSMRQHVAVLLPDEADDEFDENEWWYEELALGVMIDNVHAEAVEAARPDQFKSLVDWSQLSISGHGRYSEPLVWTDTELVKALEATGDRHSVAYRASAKQVNKPAWKRMKEDLGICLDGTSWAIVTGALLSEFEALPDAEIMVDAYCPNDILWGLDHAYRSDGDRSHLPVLSIGLKTKEFTRLYYGMLLWDGLTYPTSLKDTVGIAIAGDITDYLIWRTSGGLWTVDALICQLHGLHYHVMEFFPDEATRPPNRLAIDDAGALSRIEHHDSDPAIRPWSEFISGNRQYLSVVKAAFDKHVYRP